MMELTVEGEYFIEGRGLLFHGPLPVTIQDRSELNGKEILINGEVHIVKGVELFMHMPPWREGESCGILV
jgi:hypothetical protein